MALFGSTALVLALWPNAYGRANRVAIARHIYYSTWPVLPWFAATSALISLVLIRIVVVTALSYGLSQYALEMMVRVLVLELIPLSAALFVALRVGLGFDPLTTAPPSQVATEEGVVRKEDMTHAYYRRAVPAVIANACSVLSLAMLSSVIVLVLAYLNIYGFSPWGLNDYTRTVGRVFDPVVSAGFALKTLLFGLAVAVIPMAAMLERTRLQSDRNPVTQPGALRLLVVLLLIEVASLALKYI